MQNGTNWNGTNWNGTNCKSMREAGHLPLFGTNGSQVKWGLYLKDPQRAQKVYRILKYIVTHFTP